MFKAIYAVAVALVFHVALGVVGAGAAGPPADGLVAYWSFDEGEGDIAFDQSGNCNDGIIHGAAWVRGKLGNALSFDGVADHVEVPHTQALNLKEAFSVCAWVFIRNYHPSPRAGDTILFKGVRVLLFVVRKGNHVLQLMATAGGQLFSSYGRTPLQTGQWYHVAFTYDGSQIRVYVNGEPDREPVPRVGELETNDLPLLIGAASYGDGLDGILDEVRIYNRALDEDEVRALFQMASPE